MAFSSLLTKIFPYWLYADAQAASPLSESHYVSLQHIARSQTLQALNEQFSADATLWGSQPEFSVSDAKFIRLYAALAITQHHLHPDKPSSIDVILDDYLLCSDEDLLSSLIQEESVGVPALDQFPSAADASNAIFCLKTNLLLAYIHHNAQRLLSPALQQAVLSHDTTPFLEYFEEAYRENVTVQAAVETYVIHQRKQLYLDKVTSIVQSLNPSNPEVRGKLLGLLFKTVESRLGLATVYPSDEVFGAGVAPITFDPAQDQAYAHRFTAIRDIAFKQYATQYVDQLDLSVASNRAVLELFVEHINTGRAPAEFFQTTVESADFPDIDLRACLLGDGIDISDLKPAWFDQLALLYKAKYHDHHQVVARQHDFENDADIVQRLQIPASFIRVMVEVGLLRADYRDDSQHILSQYHHDVELMFGHAAHADLSISEDTQKAHRAVCRSSHLAAARVKAILTAVNQKLEILDDHQPGMSQIKARLNVVKDGLSLYQTFLTRYKKYHMQCVRKISVGLRVGHTGLWAGGFIDIEQPKMDAQIAYAQLFRTEADWQLLLQGAHHMQQGKVHMVFNDARLIPKTAEEFKTVFAGASSLFESQKMSLSSPTTQKDSVGTMITALEVTMPNNEKVTLAHHEHTVGTDKQALLKVSGGSAQSIARVLALSYKLKLQKDGHLNAAGQPVGEFVFNLADDQINLSHGGKLGAVSASEREAFLAELDTVFLRMFGKATYQGRVSQAKPDSMLKTGGMQSWRHGSGRVFQSCAAEAADSASQSGSVSPSLA